MNTEAIYRPVKARNGDKRNARWWGETERERERETDQFEDLSRSDVQFFFLLLYCITSLLQTISTLNRTYKWERRRCPCTCHYAYRGRIKASRHSCLSSAPDGERLTAEHVHITAGTQTQPGRSEDEKTTAATGHSTKDLPSHSPATVPTTLPQL
jgi:hypothetical protein